MEFHKITIAEPSARVLGKMKKGHKVRIAKGEGFELLVNPSNYDTITKTFMKGKGLHLALSPEEIAHNHGQGVFKSFKKGLKKVGKALKPVGHALINEAVKLAPKLGASALTGLALAAGQPELVPLAQVVGNVGGRELGKLAGKKAHKGIDKSYGRKAVAQPIAPVSQPVLSAANIEDYLKNASLAELESAIVSKRKALPVAIQRDYSGGSQVLAPYTDAVPTGQGLYAGGSGQGLYASARSHRGRGIIRRMEKASVGVHGNLLGHGIPPALQSQPYSANFQFASRLPPAYAVLQKAGV